MAYRYLLFLVMFLLIIVPVSAKMTIEQVKESYDLGEDITPLVRIEPESNIQALFTAELLCSEYQKEYFIQPLKLEEGKVMEVAVPPLETFEQMKGTCTLNVKLNSVVGAEIDKAWTDGFIVTDQEFTASKETPIEDTEEPLPESVETNEEITAPEETNEEIPLEEKESDEEASKGAKESEETLPINKTRIYGALGIILLVILLYFFLKFKFRNKNPFNRGWKLPKK